MFSGLAHQNLEPNVSHKNELDLPFGRVINKGWMTCATTGEVMCTFIVPNKVKNMLIKYTDRMSGRVPGIAYKLQIQHS